MDLSALQTKIEALHISTLVSVEEMQTFERLIRMHSLMKDVLNGYASVPIWKRMDSEYDMERSAKYFRSKIDEHMEKTRELIKLVEDE